MTDYLKNSLEFKSCIHEKLIIGHAKCGGDCLWLKE